MDERVSGGARVAATAALLLFAAARAVAADAERGRSLYEARCGGCHNESVHNDSSRKARNFEEVRARVAEFSARVKTGWSGRRINDVTVYLNERYYGFPCPSKLCPKPPGAKR
jgi:mono/diheme cytochrome c family protein